MVSNNNYSLPPGTQLENYQLTSVLNVGGFSIVYLGIDQSNGAKVVIKEYMPFKLAMRNADLQVVNTSDETFGNFNEGRKLIFQEANALLKLKHPNIVNVTNFFTANNTVYIVMDYRKGENLQSCIRKYPQGLSETLIRTIFPPLLDGLRMVHNVGLLHLDIKPGNIHLLPGGQPLLLDFGAVHRTQMSRQHQPASVVTIGFSPVEQYEPNGYFGPWTDIYAIGATIRACIEGKPPPHAIHRREKDTLRPATQVHKKKYSQSLLHAIDWSMEVDPTLRPQTVEAFLTAFNQEDRLVANGGEVSVFERIANHIPWLK